LGLFRHALGIFKQGECFLLKLPNHKFMDSIRLAYYNKIGEAYNELNDFGLAKNYFDLATITNA
jgi:hypothetical protein